MRLRLGSALSVVLPVPLSPKKTHSIPILTDIGRAVHREDVLIDGKNKIQSGKYALLDLACIAGSTDKYFFSTKINN